MPKDKIRIVIKDLPKRMLISEAEKKKILGGWTPSYMNQAMRYLNFYFWPR